MTARRLAALTMAVAALTIVPAGTAAARSHTGLSSFDQRLLYDINATRTHHGLAAVSLNGGLESIATAWADRVAQSQRAVDNPNLRRAMNQSCSHWRYVGENVGDIANGTADELFAMYMRDPARRQTLLSRRFAAVGLATTTTVASDGTPVYWNVVDLADSCRA